MVCLLPLSVHSSAISNSRGEARAERLTAPAGRSGAGQHRNCHVQELLYYGPTVRSTPYFMLPSAYFCVTGALCTAPGLLEMIQVTLGCESWLSAICRARAAATIEPKPLTTVRGVSRCHTGR